MASEHEQFPHTKRLCKIFRLLLRKRRLISGPGMNVINLYKWEFIVNTGITLDPMTPEEIDAREETSRIGCQCLLFGELLSCGIEPQHSRLPEPAGTPSPEILRLLREG